MPRRNRPINYQKLRPSAFWSLVEQAERGPVPGLVYTERYWFACKPTHSTRLVAPPGVDGFETGLPKPHWKLLPDSLVVVGPSAAAAVSWVAFLAGSVPLMSDLQRDREKSGQTWVVAFD